MNLDPNRINILLIEDDDLEAELIADQLDDAPLETRLVRVDRVALGLEELQGAQPDIILLDFNLPDGNGIENIKRVKTAAADSVPIIILTNVEDDASAIESVRHGAQDYLIKRTITTEVLSRAIRYAIARHAAEISLRESEERYALAVAGARDGVWDWNLNSNQVYYSARWCRMLQLEPEQIEPTPRTWFDHVHEADRASLQKLVDNHLRGASSHLEAEFRMRRGDGEVIWTLARGVAVRNRDGRATRIAGSLSDITDRKTTEAMLMHEALHDALTGLPNRNLFLDRLELALKQYRRDPSRNFAVLFLDLDRFKSVNDSLGHAAGDELLIGFGQRLSMFLRPGDSIARLGGDEFAILLMHISDLSEATVVAERVHELLSQKFLIEDKELVVSVSIGIALSDGKYEHPSDMLRDADLAMYRTKHQRGGSYAVFDNLMHEHALRKLELETDLRTALARDQMSVHYQPIVSLEHMRITGFEALMRWHHPTRGMIPPEEFIPLAEASGVISSLTWWVLTLASRQTRHWQLSAEPLSDLSISVNVSGHLFSEADFAEKTIAVLKETGLPPASLHLEITENALLEHEAATIRELTALQNLGVKLHLDDFGTGYSSLSYLSLFDYDTIKIDRSFMNPTTSVAGDRRIVDALVSLGRVLNIGVIAEGVETPEQVQKLKDLDCSMAQGFWFSKPLPPIDAESLLSREKDLPLGSIRKIVSH